MPAFRYRALAPDGRPLEGRMEAADAEAVAAALRAKGRWTVEIRPAAGEGDAAGRRGGGVRDAELALLARELSALLAAGAPVDRALGLLQELAPSARARRFVSRVEERVRAGAALSDAMAQAGLGAAGGRASLIRAGEAAGEVDGALGRLAATLERTEALRQAIRSALLYPGVVAAAALGALALLTLLVLPRFEEIFVSAGARLPGAAGALLDFSRWLSANAIAIGGGGAAAAALLVAWARSPSGALTLSRIGLATPLIGGIGLRLDAARFCRTLGLLLEGGAPATEAAAHAVAAMERRAMRWRARGFPAEIGAGSGLAAAMARTGAFPSAALGLARIGEESGAAPAMLAHAAALLEAGAERDARRAVQLVAPAATLLLGGLVAMIVVSMMTAMLSLNQVI